MTALTLRGLALLMALLLGMTGVGLADQNEEGAETSPPVESSPPADEADEAAEPETPEDDGSADAND